MSDAAHPPLRLCLVNFTGERVNWGCRATSWELVRVLNRCLPTDRPVEFDTVPLVPHHALDRSIPERDGDRLCEILERVSPSEEDRAWMLDLARVRYRHFVDRVESADLVLFQAEGTMTGTDFLRAERLLILPWVAKHVFGKRVLTLNQTCFSSDEDFTRAMRVTLASMDRVWVREPASLDWLEANGLRGARVVPDTAFLTDPLPHGPLVDAIGERETLCVTGSATLQADDVDAYLDAVRAIAVEHRWALVFVGSAGQDALLGARAQERWPEDEIFVARTMESYPAVASLLGRARLLIGGRYHLALLAAVSGTPSVLLGTNTHKLDGLRTLLGVDWPIRSGTAAEPLAEDARARASEASSRRDALIDRVAALRVEIVNAFEGWADPGKDGIVRLEAGPVVAPEASPSYAAVNAQISGGFRYREGDDDLALFGPPPHVLPQLLALTLYLRRGVESEATFRSFRFLIEGRLDLVLDQLDSRWLVSICDSYSDFGDPVESRNALLISTWLNWERLAATYARRADPERRSRALDAGPATPVEPLWDGLSTIHLAHGDTTNNLLGRIARSLEATPVLLRIWRTLLERIRTHDSIGAALASVHPRFFEEDTDWMALPELKDAFPSWRIPSTRPKTDSSSSHEP